MISRIIYPIHRPLENWQFLSVFYGIWKCGRFSYKNVISWRYVDRDIFFNMRDMDLIFDSGESWMSILYNSKHDLRPKYKGGAFRYIEHWWKFWKNTFFKKITQGALWGAIRILKPWRCQKWKKRPIFYLELTYHVPKAPPHSSKPKRPKNP